MKFFILTPSGIEINTPEILLIKEFGDLYDIERNKCEKDPKGERRLRFYKEIVYIYTKIDFESYCHDYREDEKTACALSDSGLTKSELDDPVFKAALEEYQHIQYKDPYMRILDSAMRAVYKAEDYFNGIDFTTLNPETNLPMYKPKEMFDFIKQLPDMFKTLDDLKQKIRTKKQEEVELQGGVEKGMFD